MTIYSHNPITVNEATFSAALTGSISDFFGWLELPVK